MDTSAHPTSWKTIVWASGRVDAIPAKDATPAGAVIILTADHATTQAVILPLIRVNTAGGYMELPTVADAPDQRHAMDALLNIQERIKAAIALGSC